MAEKLDPFDVAALEKSVNDSAVRVSTIWVSYLIFGLYLVIAAGNVTHRQLFLEEPVKLPVLNIDLPLVGFFFLAPVLFVIFHAYVLIQVVLLARTAASYNDAVDHNIKNETYNARIRQRLANTLFAQIFAGSPREREGMLGVLLRSMAWVTLAIAPVLIVLTFELKFLPYHSPVVTWVHRFLVAVDLTAVLLMWPVVLHPERQVTWRNIVRSPIASPLAALLIVGSVILSFPGEPHATWTRYQFDDRDFDDGYSIECHARSWQDWLLASGADRLSLAGEDLVDDDRLSRIESAGNAKGLQTYEGERTRSFRQRDLRCGDFSGTDLRRVDFANAIVSGAKFDRAELQGASFFKAQLRDSTFFWAQLQGTNFSEAAAQGAAFGAGRIQGAYLAGAQLQGSSFFNAQLQGARFDNANLQGASFDFAQLQGARFHWARLEGASLAEAQLQGAYLAGAVMDGATLAGAQLYGANVGGSRLVMVNALRVHVRGVGRRTDWPTFSRAGTIFLGHEGCGDAQVVDPRFDAVLRFPPVTDTGPSLTGTSFSDFGRAEDDLFDETMNARIEATSDNIRKFVEEVVRAVPQAIKPELLKILWHRLTINQDEIDVSERVWRDCASKAEPKDVYYEKLATLLINLACLDEPHQRYVARGIARHWRLDDVEKPPRKFALTVINGLLGIDGKPCPGAKDIGEKTKRRLRDFAKGGWGS